MKFLEMSRNDNTVNVFDALIVHLKWLTQYTLHLFYNSF
jgi:hypothetical protein